jgi:hypothetical protein
LARPVIGSSRCTGGAWAHQDIDHRNGVKSYNHPRNLRLADKCEQRWNVGPYANNTTGVKGVQKKGRGFQASIQAKFETHYLGTFDTLLESRAVRLAAERLFHGEFRFKYKELIDVGYAIEAAKIRVSLGELSEMAARGIGQYYRHKFSGNKLTSEY